MKHFMQHAQKVSFIVTHSLSKPIKMGWQWNMAKIEDAPCMK